MSGRIRLGIALPTQPKDEYAYGYNNFEARAHRKHHKDHHRRNHHIPRDHRNMYTIAEESDQPYFESSRRGKSKYPWLSRNDPWENPSIPPHSVDYGYGLGNNRKPHRDPRDFHKEWKAQFEAADSYHRSPRHDRPHGEYHGSDRPYGYDRSYGSDRPRDRSYGGRHDYHDSTNSHHRYDQHGGQHRYHDPCGSRHHQDYDGYHHRSHSGQYGNRESSRRQHHSFDEHHHNSHEGHHGRRESRGHHQPHKNDKPREHSEPYEHNDVPEFGGPSEDNKSYYSPRDYESRHRGTPSPPESRNGVNPVAQPTELPDHYRILGLSPNATQAEIEKASKAMRISTHPDKCKKPGMTEEELTAIDKLAGAVGQAAETLKDPSSRAAYDYELLLRNMGGAW